MKLCSKLDGWHTVLTVDSGDGTRYCGDSWCCGECGLPALVTESVQGTDLKAFGSQVACGPVFQPFRGEWTGSKVRASEHPETLRKKMWW